METFFLDNNLRIGYLIGIRFTLFEFGHRTSGYWQRIRRLDWRLMNTILEVDWLLSTAQLMSHCR